jgi:hypothetical protein
VFGTPSRERRFSFPAISALGLNTIRWNLVSSLELTFLFANASGKLCGWNAQLAHDAELNQSAPTGVYSLS